jgi:hypothetical protein
VKNEFLEIIELAALKRFYAPSVSVWFEAYGRFSAFISPHPSFVSAASTPRICIVDLLKERLIKAQGGGARLAGTPVSAGPPETPWGLISASLGN